MIRERFICKSAMMGALAALLLVFGQAMAAETAASGVAATEPAASGVVAAAPVPATKLTQASAVYVGEKACTTCHDAENKSFGHTTHAKAFRENASNATEQTVCEACHGPGSLHIKNTKDRNLLTGFSKGWGSSIERMNGQCLNCHKGGQRIFWEGSIHQTNKLACSDCHNPMAKFSGGGLLKKPSITETCQSCHQQQRAEFKKKSHMPVPEGKMSCEDCHNPHGTTNKRLLKADTVNELCYTCHAEKRGPFIWEHAPVRENCMNCHVPHGSNNDKLLVQTRPFLCAGCHSTTGSMGHQVWGTNSTGDGTTPTSTTNGLGTLTIGGVTGATVASKRMTGRSCQNCHSTIHGSNSPGGARFQR